MYKPYEYEAIRMLDKDLANGETELSEWREELSDSELDDIFTSVIDVREMEGIHAAVIRAVCGLTSSSKTLGDIIHEIISLRNQKEILIEVSKAEEEEAYYRALRFYEEAYLEKKQSERKHHVYRIW